MNGTLYNDAAFMAENRDYGRRHPCLFSWQDPSLYTMQKLIQLQRRFPFFPHNQIYGKHRQDYESWLSLLMQRSPIHPYFQNTPTPTATPTLPVTCLPYNTTHALPGVQDTLSLCAPQQTLPLNLCVSDQPSPTFSELSCSTPRRTSMFRVVDNTKSPGGLLPRLTTKPETAAISAGRIIKRDWREKTKMAGKLRNLPYSCAVCCSVFAHMQHLNDHFLASHPESIQSNLSQTPSPKVHFRAQLQALLSEEQHKTVTKRTSTSTGVPRSARDTSDEAASATTAATGYRCPKCDYLAKWPTELQKHVMVHSSRRPFVCFVCSTSYKWSWDLGRHFANSHPTLPNPYKKLSSRGSSRDAGRLTHSSDHK